MKSKRKAAEEGSEKMVSSSPATNPKEAREPHQAVQNGSGLVKGKRKQQEGEEKRQKKKRKMDTGTRNVFVAESVHKIEAIEKASTENKHVQAEVGSSGRSQIIDEGEGRQQVKAEGKRSKKKRKLSVEGKQKLVKDEKRQDKPREQHEGSEEKKRDAGLEKGVTLIRESRGKGDERSGTTLESRTRKKKRKKGRQQNADVIAATESVKQGGDTAGGVQLAKVALDKRPFGKVETPDLRAMPVGGAALQKLAPKQSPLLEKMRARLQGGQFRMLNEQLYTSRGDDSFAAFQRDPVQFQHYHRGYQEQMAHWPKLPVEVAGEWLRARDPSLVVADFGCGDARLAANVKNKVFSLDLVAAKPGVIACNMAHTPLKSSSVDVAVFCLSLMGTDYGSFLEEAHRVLVLGGWLLIAEVKSRFDPQNGGADPKAFVDALKSLGFQKKRLDESNKMFVWWEFCKVGEKKGQHAAWPKLKACIYKRR